MPRNNPKEETGNHDVDRKSGVTDQQNSKELLTRIRLFLDLKGQIAIKQKRVERSDK